MIDPPYGINESGQTNKSRSKLAKSKDYGNKNWDYNSPKGGERRMRLIVVLLKFINVLLGGVVVVGGIAAYFIIERPIPLFLALGLVALT